MHACMHVRRAAVVGRTSFVCPRGSESVMQPFTEDGARRLLVSVDAAGPAERQLWAETLMNILRP